MLADKSFDYSYSPIDEQQPGEFFLQAFRNSIRLEMGLGFFSSASFNVLADGFASFIVNGGSMSMYINQYITKDDWDMLRAEDADNNFDQELVNSYERLKDTLSKRDKHFFECLSYLIREGRLNVKILVLANGGLPHEKYGIFTDEQNNKVHFNGSLNMTANALLGNLETIECTCSWEGAENKKKIETFEQHFHKVWNGNVNGIKIYEAKEFCKVIARDYPKSDPVELVTREEEFIAELNLDNNKKPSNAPHFPHKYSAPFQYQKDAYDSWKSNGKKGIFAMATGTGKTVTALNCALNEFNSDNYYHLLILVPTLDLVGQWINELKAFNFKKIIEVSSKNLTWRKTLVETTRKMKRNNSENFAIVSTYISFTNDDFQKLLPLLSDGTILIADEVHNVGSKNVNECFDKMTISRRIGLSATPERIYDEEGTNRINSYFNDNWPYTYSFPMSRAIKEGRLCKYEYYPRLAYLNEDEFREYKYYTTKLMQLWDSSKQKFSNKAEADIILMNRKRIIHKCNDKLRVFKDIIQEIGGDRLKYTFVYSPEGDINNGNEDIQNGNVEKNFIKELLKITKETFPNITCSSFTSAKDSKQRKALLDGFEEGKINVLFAMKCLDEGVDIPRTQYGIFTSSTGNPRQFIQRRGRLLRTHPNKKRGYIYDIIVLPSFRGSGESVTAMERSVVKPELVRAAYFASLSENHLTKGGSFDILCEIAHHYGIIWSDILKEIEEKQ